MSAEELELKRLLIKELCDAKDFVTKHKVLASLTTDADCRYLNLVTAEMYRSKAKALRKILLERFDYKVAEITF